MKAKELKETYSCSGGKACFGRRKGAGMHTFILIWAILATVLLVLFLAGFYVLYTEVAKGNAASMEHKSQNYQAVGEKAPEGCTIFFGDSITELCPLSDIYGSYTLLTGLPVCNRGISAECTPSMLERFEKSVVEAKPKNLVMLMGVNDLQQGIPREETLANIQKMIRRMKQESPGTNIILQALYPVSENRKSLYERFMIGKRTNAMIREFNVKLAALAKEEGVLYVDMTETFADESGNLKEEYTVDGLHPSTRGYELAAKEILPLLE